jgi:hypothetical protein
MPNATVGANAPASPKSDDKYDALAAQIAAEVELKIATERAEDAAKAEDTKMRAGREFSAAYRAWLKAKAALEDHDGDDEEATERYRAESAAERRLMASPAAWPDQVWLKLGAFEVILSDELMNGERRDSVILLSLASIKQDILNLDMCSKCGGAS